MSLKEQRRKNKEIEQQLLKDKKSMETAVKLLLLGKLNYF